MGAMSALAGGRGGHDGGAGGASTGNRPAAAPSTYPRGRAYAGPYRPRATGFAEEWQMPLEGVAAMSANTAAEDALPEPQAADHPLGAARAQLHRTYIVAETPSSVILVDQHAAHERLVYEKLKAAMADGGVESQMLLMPQVVELDADTASLLVSRAGDLARLGLAIEAFGGGAVLVREVPALIAGGDVGALIRDLAEEIEMLGTADSLEARLHEICARIACHGSVRAGRRLTAGRDERSAARDGSDAPRPRLQPRPPDLHRAATGRYREAVRPALVRLLTVDEFKLSL